MEYLINEKLLKLIKLNLSNIYKTRRCKYEKNETNKENYSEKYIHIIEL